MQFQESGATGGTRGPVDGEERMRRMLTEAIGEALGIRPDRILSPVRGTARVALARQVAIYLARTRLGLSFTEAGRLFRRDRTTAAHACRRVEETRDDAVFDALIDSLDATIAGRLAARDCSR
jgi:chromosomal replication initiation ATPase DnaA